MLFNDKVVSELVADVNSGDGETQAKACQHIRDLCGNSDQYRQSFVAAGVLGPLCGLLDDVAARRNTAVVAAQALQHLAQKEEWRLQMRDQGGVDNMVEALRKDKEVPETCLEAVLAALKLFAADSKTRESITGAGALQAVVKLISNDHCEEVTAAACDVLQALAYSRDMQDKIRMSGGLSVLVKKVSNLATERAVIGAALRAVTVLVVVHQENQDELRFLGGVSPILKQLQLSPYDDTTAAAADALRAACQNNDGNKTLVRKEWGIPLLVLLLAPGVPRGVVERVVDCLRILTTGCDENKAALMGCASALPYLVLLLGEGDDTIGTAGGGGQSDVLTERAASVLRNLTTISDHFGPLRESGVVQKLVRLLDKGPESKLTQVAVVAVANLVQDEHNRKSVRLAGGVPPLLQLMLDNPDREIQESAELALERLAVSDTERNAILDAFRYSESRLASLNAVTLRVSVEEDSSKVVDGTRVIGPKPLTRYSPEDTAVLLHNLALPDVSLIPAQGVTGGELLELTLEDCVQELGWTKLQHKKVVMVQRAFHLFNRICATPGQGEIAFIEMQRYLEGLGGSASGGNAAGGQGGALQSSDVLALLSGLRDACLTPGGGTLTFQDFARSYYWLTTSLEAMGVQLMDAAASNGLGGAAGDGPGCSSSKCTSTPGHQPGGDGGGAAAANGVFGHGGTAAGKGVC